MPIISTRPQCCGVYRITNVVTGECYVGKSRDIGCRFWAHLRMLNAGRHHSRSFQRAYDVYGFVAFRLDFLEECEPKDLDARERHWISELQPAFNGPGDEGMPEKCRSEADPLDLLTRKQREALRLRDEERLPHSEIAKRLGISHRSNATKLITRARKKVRLIRKILAFEHHSS